MSLMMIDVHVGWCYNDILASKPLRQQHRPLEKSVPSVSVSIKSVVNVYSVRLDWKKFNVSLSQAYHTMV